VLVFTNKEMKQEVQLGLSQTDLASNVSVVYGSVLMKQGYVFIY